uniref:Uncharacterized protein n=1 Tax=Romanomermis culicivorax TaxID=13658 RepID=A0A915IV04_ROMCU
MGGTSEDENLKLANQRRCSASYSYVRDNLLKWISEITTCSMAQGALGFNGGWRMEYFVMTRFV